MEFTYPDKFTYLNTFVIQVVQRCRIMEVLLYMVSTSHNIYWYIVKTQPAFLCTLIGHYLSMRLLLTWIQEFALLSIGSYFLWIYRMWCCMSHHFVKTAWNAWRLNLSSSHQRVSIDAKWDQWLGKGKNWVICLAATWLYKWHMWPSQQKPAQFTQLSQHYLQCLRSGYLKFQLNQACSFEVTALDSQASKYSNHTKTKLQVLTFTAITSVSICLQCWDLA